MNATLPMDGAVKTYRWPGLLPILIIGLPVAIKLAGVDIANAWIIFALLFGLMLTGMPISISLGLTVLTYLFFMTSVPIQSVALKLFTGIEKFEIMAIPFFILAGNFLTHGGVARRMIDFASACVGHWHGGLARRSFFRRWSPRAFRSASARVSSPPRARSASSSRRRS